MQHNNHFTRNDVTFMQKAIALAKQGNPSPNPYVGCVIVKNGRIISTGYHHKAGQNHAEINALHELKGMLRKMLTGATMYLTMEPCTHYGRTPPCIDKVIASGIRKVIIGSRDSNPINHGKGVEKLRKAGIKVKVGLLEREVKELNKVFNKYITTRLPYVFLKAAMTQNKIIAWGNRQAQQITGEEAKRFTHLLRNKCDAILVGINTVLRDDPQLTCRLAIDEKRDPKRIILDSTLKIPLTAQVLHDNHVIIFTTKNCDNKQYQQLVEKRIEIIVLESEKADITQVLKELAARQISSILIEGGATVYKSALLAGCVDEVLLLIAPFSIEDQHALSVFDDETLQHFRLEELTTTKFGNDTLVAGKVKYI